MFPCQFLNKLTHVMNSMEISDLMPRATDTCSNECLDINSEGSHSSKRKSTSRVTGQGEPTAKKPKHRGDETGDKATTYIFDNIEKKIARQYLNSKDEPENEKFEITSLLQSIHFERLMNNIGQMDECTNIPLVTKKYEEKFLRGSIYQHEKNCIMDYQCECMFIDEEIPFVGTRFCLPNSDESDNGMCVLCIRKSTQLLFYHTINKGITPQAPIQKYGNICGQAGEYHVSAMLLCPPNGPVHCMPLPVVAHQRNRYSVYKNAGIPYIKQNKMAYEDF